MSERRFRKGDVVRFWFTVEPVQGVIVEDRGPIGLKGRRLYRIEFGESDYSSPMHLELPAEQFELVSEATAAG